MENLTCVICGRPAQVFANCIDASSGKSESKQFCREHAPDPYGATQIRERLITILALALSNATSPVSEVRFSFVIQGRAVDVARLEGRLSHHTELEMRQISHSKVESVEEGWVQSITPWYSVSAPLESAARLLDFMLDLCLTHNCKCISQGVEVR